MFYKKFVIKLLIILFIFICTPAWANIKIEEVDNPPKGALLNLTDTNKNTPNKTIVGEEVYRLENLIPALRELDWKIQIVKQTRYITVAGDIAGLASKKDKTIYLFSQPKNMVNYTVNHEIGHLIRFTFLYDDSLNEYFKLRSNGYLIKGIYNSPEELFAEDFNILFGSEDARKEEYRPDYKKPELKEKIWMIQNLNLDFNILTWQEKLRYYEINTQAGIEEVERVEKVIQQKHDSGDKKGTLYAKNWLKLLQNIAKPI